MTDLKPKHSLQTAKYLLTEESYMAELLSQQIDDKTALEGVITNLSSSKSNIPDLINTLLYYIAESDGLERSLDAEIDRLEARRNRFKTRSKNIRESINNVMGRFDIKKLECPFGTICQINRDNSKLVVTDEGMILSQHPEYFIRQKPKLDRAALRASLQEGTIVEGASLINTNSIMIRK